MTRWKIVLLAVAIGASALAAGLATQRMANTPKTAAPDHVSRFLATSLPDLRNKPQKPDDWAGKIRVINFWATWCPPCREEIPVFMQAQKHWGPRNVQIIGVAIDNPKAVTQFARGLGMNYPTLLAEETGVQAMQDLGNKVGALPFTLIVDGRGTVLQRYAGPVNKTMLDSWLHKASVAVEPAR